MTIIDSTSPPAPILEWKQKPTFKSRLEKDKYWQEQEKYWREGYLDIPGTLYHKTQEQWIKDRDLGDIFRPTCRDVDLLIHQEIADCRKQGEALLIIKGRGVGLSTEMGCLANYFMKVYTGTTSLLTSQEQQKIASLFSEKVAVTYDRYDEEIKPVEINRNETKASCYLKTEQLYLDEYGKVQKNTSQIICRETSDSVASASAFSGQGAILGCYDEIFLHKRRVELVSSSTSCFINHKTRKTTGFLLAGGTCEHTLTNAQLFDLQKLIEEVKNKGRLGTMKCRLLFIPCWMGTHMTNGWSDEKRGKEWWEKEIEELEKLKDPDALRAFKMNNPMTLDDIFELTSGQRFSDTISDKIKLHTKVVKNENPPILNCNLVDLGTTVETIEAKKGNMWILQHPQPNVEYLQLIDGVGIGKKEGGERGSSIASVIMQMYNPAGNSYSPVCIHLNKPDVVPDDYPHLVSQLKYYNKFNCLKGTTWEHAQGMTDHWAAYLYNQNLGKFIINRRDISGKGNIDEKKIGQPITIDARKFQYRAANEFLAKYLTNIKMLMLLEDMLKPINDNADILDAWLLFFSAVPLDFDKPVIKKVIQPRMKRILTVENFRTVEKWIPA